MRDMTDQDLRELAHNGSLEVYSLTEGLWGTLTAHPGPDSSEPSWDAHFTSGQITAVLHMVALDEVPYYFAMR